MLVHFTKKNPETAKRNPLGIIDIESISNKERELILKVSLKEREIPKNFFAIKDKYYNYYAQIPRFDKDGMYLEIICEEIKND